MSAPQQAGAPAMLTMTVRLTKAQRTTFLAWFHARQPQQPMSLTLWTEGKWEMARVAWPGPQPSILETMAAWQTHLDGAAT